MLATSVRRLHDYLTPHLPLRLPHHRSPTTPAPTAPGRSRTALAARAARRAMPCTSTQKGRGRALRAGLAGERRRRGRVHGRRPVDRPGRAPAAGRAAAVGPQRPRDRHPAGVGSPGRARRRSASSSRAPTTCCCAARCGPGSPTPSAASRRSAPTCARALLPLVEDDGAGSSTPSCCVLAERARAAHPRGAGRLGRRPRQPGRHRHDGHGRPARHGPRRPRAGDRAAALAEVRRRLGRAAREPPARRAPTLPGQLVRFAVDRRR